jgi:hypothetical protein
VELGISKPSWNVLAVGPVSSVALGEAVHDQREQALSNQADAWISCQKGVPANAGQFGWRTLQTENMVEGETESGLVRTMKSVVKKLPTFLAVGQEEIDSESTT